MQNKFTFSGHDSFFCKHYWLKKGYDFIKNQHNKFTNETAVVELGVGKNMVSSIRFWLKSFGLTDEKDDLLEIAHYLFGDDGKDLFVEDIGTMWLLHYLLVKTGKASIYSLFFNDFIRRRRGQTFTKNQFRDFLRMTCEENKFLYNENTINTDISTFLRTYLKPDKDKSNIEDSFVGLLIELALIRKFEKVSEGGKKEDVYDINIDNKDDLPYQIVLYAILDNYETYGNSIPFNLLLNGDNSPGRVFALSADGLFEKIEEITNKYPAIVYSETAGNKELQFKALFHKSDILDAYFKSI